LETPLKSNDQKTSNIFNLTNEKPILKNDLEVVLYEKPILSNEKPIL
jgi:hypothetical protein